ncbi:MAG: hypothetical protein E6294_02830, partial [Klebsiella sp.]|nr:hypothetical protein [Klebsiella sp.]
KDKFDEFFIVFTDYTGEKEREVKKERIEKDPILFGAFLNEETKVVADRFYFLGDWIDEYCDLTLDKMICSMKELNLPNAPEEKGIMVLNDSYEIGQAFFE